MRKANPYERLAKLVTQAQAGDRTAFEKVYRLTAQAQYFTIAAKTNADAAPDLLQEVYLIAWKNIANVRPRSIVGYLNAVTRNVCLRYYERASQPRETPLTDKGLEMAEQHADREGEPSPEHVTDPALVANTRDERLRLARALKEELDDREREIILMRFYQDMRLDDIAENLNTSESTVKRTIKRALGKLRDKLGFIPFGSAFADLLRQAVENPLADGAQPRLALSRRSPLDHGVRAVAALSAIAVAGCVGFAAMAHAETHGPQPIEGASTPASASASPQPDIAAPTLIGMRTDRGISVLRFTDESGMAAAQLMASDGTTYSPLASEETADGRSAVEYRFSVPSGTYTVVATDRAGNVATGEITVDILPDDPGPYAPVE